MTRFERWAIWTTTVAVAVSGFGYTWTKYFVTTPDLWAAINHPLEPWFLRVHVVSAPLFVFAFGLIAVKHVWKHITNGVRRARRSGWLTALVLVPMVLTGYLVQVVTHVGWLGALAVGHIALGVLYVVGVLAHQAVLSAARRRSGGVSGCGALSEVDAGFRGAADETPSRRGPKGREEEGVALRPTAGSPEPRDGRVAAGAAGEHRR